jgi:hypothetical protein
LSLLIETSKNKVERIILKIWVQNEHSSVKVGSLFLSVIEGLKEKGKQWNFSSLSSSLRKKDRIALLKLRTKLSPAHNLSNIQIPCFLFE